MDLPANVMMATSAEMICGGVTLIGLSAVVGEWETLELSTISVASWMSAGYLVVFGSIIAFGSYMWLLKNVAASRVATYSYVNPVIAVFLGWLIFSEPITPRTLVAIAVIVSAVVIIVKRRSKS